MKSIQIMFIILLVLSFTAKAQSPAEYDVMKPIHELFAGMKKGDSAMAHKAFNSQISFATVTKDKDGKPLLRKTFFQDFLKRIGTPHDEVWNELTWDPIIKIDGNLAQVWVKYGFYRGNKLDHCGVDAFQLFKGEDGAWKIFNVADTRQTEGCVVPEGVK